MQKYIKIKYKLFCVKKKKFNNKMLRIKPAEKRLFKTSKTPSRILKTYLTKNKNMLYYKRYFKINKGFTWSFKFIQNVFFFKTLQNNKTTSKYIQNLLKVKTFYFKAKLNKNLSFFLENPSRIENLFRFIYTYRLEHFKFLSNSILMANKFEILQTQIISVLLNFKFNKVGISIQNKKKKDIISLIAGFFIKYFNNKKNKKKTKLIKLLMMKFLRKIFIILQTKHYNFIIKGLPVHLNEMILTLRTPILGPFKSPFTDDVIDESNSNKLKLNFNYFIFWNTIYYHKKKLRKRGRIKRKIKRKLVLENKIID